MRNRSRGLQEWVVGALAKVSLVLTLAVLGALFMSTAASAAPVAEVAAGQTRGPSTAGMVLAVVVIAVGIGILSYGALRSGRDGDRRGMVDAHPADRGTDELGAV